MGNNLPVSIPDTISNNIEGQKLCDVLNALLLPQVSADFASPYFNIDAFSLVKEHLTKISSFKLLLGREPSIQEHVIQSGTDAVIGENLRADTEDAMSQRETPSLIKELVDFLKRDAVEVRLYGPFLHGKAFIIANLPLFDAVAIHGSSNFTAAGLTRQGEFNSVLKQATAVKEIRGWFDGYWNKSNDFKAQLIELFSDFTTKYSPFEIYIKALYEYFKDRFQMEANVEGPSPILLADFQRDGYLAAKDIVDTYDGVMLADSVGLGKTYLGLRLLDDYAYHKHQTALVICPAQLRDILWEPILLEKGISALVISQEELGRRDFHLQKLLKYETILVDESHNFRNKNANRYINLMGLLTLDKPKKLILLTATPVNNSIFDLYHQIQLISRGYDDFFASAGIRSLFGYFRRAEEDKDHLYDLLEEIAVRRSRYYVRKNFPDAIIDGKPVHFPERKLHTVHYSLEQSYQGLYQEIADAIENLNLASYSLDTYRKDIRLSQLALWDGLKERLLARGYTQEEFEKLALRLGRQVSIVHILRTLYLKRLESSVEALRISLERQAKFQEKFLEVLKQGRVLDAASYRNIFEWNGTDEVTEGQQAIDDLIGQLPQVDPKHYLIDDIVKAVEADIATLNSVLGKLPPREDLPLYDSKLQELKNLLTGELKGKKVAVFSHFKDTARYLYRHLNIADFHSSLGHNQISITDSDVGPKQRKQRILRFAPKANDPDDASGVRGTDKEIDLLFSTDVLSEGQNLQDATVIINYDLPWNPVRLIQRVGRIDRIGSDADFVHVYNFLPEDKLESLLNLVQRLHDKLDAIRRTVGLDTSTLGEAVDPKEFNAIRRIQTQDLSILDELEQVSELTIGEFVKQELLDFLKKIGEETLQRIPLGVGSGMKREGQHGLFVYLKGGDRHFWCYYDLAAGRITERRLDIIKLIQCRESTPRAEPDFDIYEVIDKVKTHVVNRFKQLQLGPLTFKSPQNHIVNLLQTPAVKEQYEVNQLVDYYSTPLPDGMLRQLRKVWNIYLQNQNIDQLVKHLQSFRAENPIAEVMPPKPSPTEQLRKEDLKLVCWLALT